MELRHIRYFLAIVEHSSFTRAAHLVNVTQSTLSHQIHQLENEIGYRLFDRVGRSVTLTKAGKAFLPGATRALSEINSAIRSVKDAAGELSGEVRLLIGTHAFALAILPNCLEQFRSEEPAVGVIVKEILSRHFISAMRSGDHDLGIAEEEPCEAPLSFEPLYNEEFGLTVSREHPLARRKRIRMVELHRLPLVLPSIEIAARRVLDKCLQSVGAEPNIVAELSHIDTLQEVARWSKTSAVFCPDPIDSDDLVFIPIEDPKPQRIIGFYWKKETPLARMLADSIRHFVLIRNLGARSRGPRVRAYRPTKTQQAAGSAPRAE